MIESKRKLRENFKDRKGTSRKLVDLAGIVSARLLDGDTIRTIMDTKRKIKVIRMEEYDFIAQSAFFLFQYQVATNNMAVALTK